MYFNHPIKNDILGTKESLIAINKENLILAHKYYYNPSNMVMIVTGNIDPNTIMDHIRSSDLLQKSRSFEQEDITIEPNDVVKANGESELDIMIPHYLFGIKLSPLSTTSKEMMKEQLVLSILSEIIMGRSSKFYNELMDQELINESFGANITLEDSYGYMILGGETEKPKELNTVIIDFMKSLETYSIDESDFIRTKKQILGGFIQSLNSLDFIANSFTKYYYHDMSLFEILDITAAIKISDIKKAKQLLINEHSYSSYTVYPKTNKK